MKRFYLLVLFTPLFAFAAVVEEVTLLRVIDGDTVLVQTVSGTEERVRIIGIDTPETVAPNRPVGCFGQEATAYAKQILENKTISLVHENERDVYERRLAYIKFEDGNDFGEQMLLNGYAYAYRAFKHPKLNFYIGYERTARNNESGLWHPNACGENKESMAIKNKETITWWRDFIKTIVALFELF